MENRTKIEPKEIPGHLIPRLLVVFTHQLEILVTTLNHCAQCSTCSLLFIYFIYLHRQIPSVLLLSTRLVSVLVVANVIIMILVNNDNNNTFNALLTETSFRWTPLYLLFFCFLAGFFLTFYKADTSPN